MSTQNRWLPVVGGVMMNMALGMFYGMSVFMLPLEKEFGWTRAQTSWVTTIGLALIASAVTATSIGGAVTASMTLTPAAAKAGGSGGA